MRARSSGSKPGPVLDAARRFPTPGASFPTPENDRPASVVLPSGKRWRVDEVARVVEGKNLGASPKSVRLPRDGMCECPLVSILILTRNEELDLPGCLRSVAWSDDVHVFDSCSTDRTRELALEAGVHFAERLFDNYAAQRNAALDGLPFKYPWVFILDCDERLSPALAQEMRSAILAAPDDLHAFRIRRNDYFLGSWLKHAQIMPFYTRLLRRGNARYVRAVNEVLEVDGSVGDLHTPFAHYPFSKGLTRWFDKHNLYSTMEARIVADQSYRLDASWQTAFFEKDFHKRRRAQKAIFYCMPCRPLLRWTYMMFYRGGVLDGHAGWTYATLQAFYEYLIVLKTRERLAELSRGLADAAALPAATSVFPGVRGGDTLAESAEPGTRATATNKGVTPPFHDLRADPHQK